MREFHDPPPPRFKNGSKIDEKKKNIYITKKFNNVTVYQCYIVIAVLIFNFDLITFKREVKAVMVMYYYTRHAQDHHATSKLNSTSHLCSLVCH